MREMKLLIFLKKEFFRMKVIYLKPMKKKNQMKNQMKTNFLKILRKNQKILTIKNYLEQKIKIKIMTQ